MKRRHRGSAYVIVLAASLGVMVLGVGAIWVARADGAARQSGRDEATARRLAESAVELGLQGAQNSMVWRSAAKAGALFTDLSVGDGTVSASVTDPVDGDVSNNLTDPISVTGTGRFGTARQMFKVTAAASATYCSCLDGAMHSHGAMTIASAVVRSSGAIGSNESVTASSATVKADVYSVGAINGTTYSNLKTAGVTAKAMPAGDAISQYAAVATAIPFGSLDSDRIRQTLLSATKNPYGGGLNARGIYSIDCGGKRLDIEDCRITATLIVTNCSSVEIKNSVHMAPWEAGLPTLLVAGDVNFDAKFLDLIESGFVNFNPSGNPYNGVTDSDLSDRYPSMFSGLVYVSGNITIKENLTVIGTVIAGGTIRIESGATVALTRRVVGAPDGFMSAPFKVDSTSFVRAVD